MSTALVHLRSTREVRLKFFLGELLLFSSRLRADVMESDWTSGWHLDPTAQQWPTSTSRALEAVVIRSCPLDRPLPRLTVLPQGIRYVPSQYRRFYIDLTGDLDAYLKKFSSKSRSTLLRKVRKFSDYAGYNGLFHRYSSSDELGEFRRLASTVSAKSYQERMFKQGLPRDEEYWTGLTRLGSGDQVRAYLLICRDVPVAYLLCRAHDGVLSYEHLGYDPAFAQWSPGTVLQYLALKSLYGERKFRLFDFTEGEGAHKEFFSTGSVFCADIYYLPRTLPNLFLLYTHWNLDRLSRAAGWLLRPLGLKTSLKRIFRRLR